MPTYLDPLFIHRVSLLPQYLSLIPIHSVYVDNIKLYVGRYLCSLFIKQTHPVTDTNKIFTDKHLLPEFRNILWCIYFNNLYYQVLDTVEDNFMLIFYYY